MTRQGFRTARQSFRTARQGFRVTRQGFRAARQEETITKTFLFLVEKEIFNNDTL